jgi:hypothetical protein
MLNNTYPGDLTGSQGYEQYRYLRWPQHLVNHFPAEVDPLFAVIVWLGEDVVQKLLRNGISQARSPTFGHELIAGEFFHADFLLPLGHICRVIRYVLGNAPSSVHISGSNLYYPWCRRKKYCDLILEAERTVGTYTTTPFLDTGDARKLATASVDT